MEHSSLHDGGAWPGWSGPVGGPCGGRGARLLIVWLLIVWLLIAWLLIACGLGTGLEADLGTCPGLGLGLAAVECQWSNVGSSHG